MPSSTKFSLQELQYPDVGQPATVFLQDRGIKSIIISSNTTALIYRQLPAFWLIWSGYNRKFLNKRH